MEIDHVIPRSAGGSNDPSNLVAACRDCNASKGADDPRVPCALFGTQTLRDMRNEAAERRAEEELSDAVWCRVWTEWCDAHPLYSGAEHDAGFLACQERVRALTGGTKIQLGPKLLRKRA